MSDFVWQALLRLYWATMRFECLHQTINEDAIAGDGSRSFHWNPFQPHCLVMFFSMAHTVLAHWFSTEASQREAGAVSVLLSFNQVLVQSGFGSIRTIKAETFALRFVSNLFPSVGRSEDTIVLTSKSGKQSIKMKPPRSFDKTIVKQYQYRQAVS